MVSPTPLPLFLGLVYYKPVTQKVADLLNVKNATWPQRPAIPDEARPTCQLHAQFLSHKLE